MIKNELFRKFFHLLFLFSIPLAHFISIRFMQASMILFGLVYYTLEQLRLKNIYVPVFSLVYKYAMRKQEQSTIAFAPINLALGIILVSEIYSPTVMYVAIIAATIGDSLAAIMGMTFPKIRMLWNRDKSLVGTLSNFLGVFACALIFTSPINALVGAFVSAIVESLNLEHADNLMIPLSVGASQYFI